ncbi:MAG: UDP-N-acetylglucosamine 1-carboxyvinyltransferase, partial [Clostridia bacterium]|nr:UDP-N-acetylglucosamine 1-carboxyvinyltransferase [Clostridia bacterium]
FMLGPLLARFKNASTFLPGGCNIGKRPIDMHIDGFKKFGVEEVCTDALVLNCKKLNGAKINLKYASVGVTENLIMCAVLAEGETVLSNCAKEPEVVCLVKFLKLFGAKIKGEGSSTIIIEGVKKLKSKNVSFMPISDRIEVGTYVLSVLGTGGEIEINNANFFHNIALIKKIYNNACKIILTNDKIYIKCSGKGNSLSYTKTSPYPKFPTDLQTPLCAYATTLLGTSYIEESVFENRFLQLNELIKMGAKIWVNGSVAKIEGVEYLNGANVSALDLRGGASLVIAGLKAQGETVIDNAFIIERGYVNLEKKLSLLGADIKKV